MMQLLHSVTSPQTTTMSASICVFVLFAVIQATQGNRPNIDPAIPTTCYGPPPGVSVQQCCPLREAQTKQELEACGIFIPKDRAPYIERSEEECKRKMCILRNKGLLNESGSIDPEKMGAYLDLQFKASPHLQDGIEKAKEICLRGKEKPQEPFLMKRPEFCEADIFYECIPVILYWNCKIPETFASCRQLKTHMEECKPFLFKKST